MFVPSGSRSMAARAPQDWSVGCVWNWIPRATSSECVLSTLSTSRLTWSMPTGFKLRLKAWRSTGSLPGDATKRNSFAEPSYHRASAVILKYLGKTKPLVELDAATETGNADADIVDSQ